MHLGLVRQGFLRCDPRFQPEFSEALAQALYTDPRFEPGMAELWDLRSAHAPLSVAEVQEIVAIGQRGAANRGVGRTAIVTSSNLEYGVARMLQVYAEVVPAVEVEVFRELEATVQWLSDIECPA